MADVAVNRPCDGDGICLTCKQKPSPHQTLHCKTCATPWHADCLSSSARPRTLAATLGWDCPDCNLTDLPPSVVGTTSNSNNGHSSDLIAAIRAIQADDSLTAEEKASKMQELHCSGARFADEGKREKEGLGSNNGVLDAIDENLICSICKELLERPVSIPCGHNFCLKCFHKLVQNGKRCAICRIAIPSNVATKPRVNLALVSAIRLAKMARSNNAVGTTVRFYQPVNNENRPDKAYTTERAKKAGMANAASGKIFVTVPSDHFGPIPAENDPIRNQGVLVGETWGDRQECRQWGVHLHQVCGIVGQSKYGAQSVVLSGGYEDDEDHGEWFLYTGSGGRDLSGNKRTNKEHSFDQKFVLYNEALRVSCRNGYPVRVVRSSKDKKSFYAPEKGVRYDGVYRVEKCWRKNGKQGFKVCRYLFVRCDNEPAPWTSDNIGDRPRPLPVVNESKKAVDITERSKFPSWDYDEERGCWMWKKPPPPSQVRVGNKGKKGTRKSKSKDLSTKLLKEFSCQICWKVMSSPLTTPCGHNFCKACLENAFSGQSLVRERTCNGRRALRAQKNIMKCPSCPYDIAEYLQNPQINRELMNAIESLQSKILEEKSIEESSEGSGAQNLEEAKDENEVEGEMSEKIDGENLEEAIDEDMAEGKTRHTRKRKKYSNGGRSRKGRKVVTT